MMNGKLIMLSGIDGSGKSSLALTLQKMLHDSCGQHSVIVDAMKSGHYAEQLKKMVNSGAELRRSFSPELLNLTWTADLLYNFRSTIQPFLENGHWVITHRSDLCCRVYSKMFAAHDEISQHLLDSLDLPSHWNFFLEIAPESAFSRICLRNRDKVLETKEQLAYLNRADEIYRQFLQTNRYSGAIVLNAERPIQELAEEVLRYLDK